MSYTLTREQLASITTNEVAFGTHRLLPAWEYIPDSFKSGNPYTKMATDVLHGRPIQDIELKLHLPCTSAADFNACLEQVIRCILAHLQSPTPRYEHKIAGVGYMIATMGSISHPA